MASGGKESDRSDDEIQKPFNTGKKNCKKILSSESEEDSDVEIRPKKVKPIQCESEVNSSADELKEIISDHRLGAEASTDLSDNEQSEKCAICLSKFLGQDIATPETCDHVFCLECLQEWAKNVNTCPIDRLKFNIILIRHHKEEKIIKKIFVNNSELPYNSELESESNTESQANFCEVCNEEEGDESLLLCHECQKFYHYACIRTLCNPHMDFWQCPTCENYIRIRDKCLLDFHRVLQSIKRRFSNSRTFPRSRISQPAMPQALRSPHSTREYARVRQRFLYQKSLVRSILSTSESSDEELDHRSANTRLYQNQVVTNGTKSRCPLMSTKRRNELYRARNQRLLTSATTAATTNSQSHYTMDSDEGYSDFRLPSSPTADNFDVVGSILQSQSLLHSPDVLTVSRDGSVLRNSSIKTRTLLNLDSMFPLSVSGENSESESPFANSSFFSDNAVSPYINKAVGKQIPLHSTQSNSKYGETPRQNYSCSSSSAPRERPLSYDECILSGSAFGGGGNERYNNEPNSPTGPKSFCCTSTSDDMKKTQDSNKDNKSHHSEDEVDIYSDIESVGEEDNSLSDQVEPVKISYKCVEESQQSDTNDVSDSTDNELVIDEDMPAEEESERITEPQGFACSKINNVAGDANARASYQVDIDCDQSSSPILNKNYDKYTGRISLKRSSCEESGKKHDTQTQNAQMNESCSDEENQESDMEVQDEENSVDSTRKSYQGYGSNSCSVKSSPKSLTQCENSIYNENDFCENDNSALEPVGKNTPEAPNSCTNDNTNDSMSQMEVDEFQENTSNVSDSTSHTEQPYKHKKYNFCVANDRNEIRHVDLNENSQPGANSNSSSAHSSRNDRRILPEECAISQSENNSHFSFSSNQQNADRSEPEDGGDSNDSNCRDSQVGSGATFNFKNSEQHIEQGETGECTDENSQNEVGEYMDENSLNETQLSPNSSKHKNDDSDGDNQVNSNQNVSVDNESSFNFSNRQQNDDDESDVEDITDSNPPPSQGVTGTVTTETINISNDETVKSDNEYEDCESFEDASTPCLDENLEGEIENSPMQAVHCENANQDFSRTPDYEYENDAPGKQEDNVVNNNASDNVKDPDVDLGIEDISEAGSEDLDEFPDEPASEKGKGNHQTKTSGATESSSRYVSDDNKKFSDQVFEDQEEGEIIEDKPARETERRKRDRYYDDTSDYVERAPRMSISDLPRIPKLKRNRDKDNVQEPPSFDNKRTSVLSRVDLGAGDVSWKRLSKHTRERSYRDGRPKDERLLYRERESRNKERKNFDNNRRTDSKSSDRRREDKKKGSEKSKNESRSRKNDKSKEDWDYSDRDKKKYHKDHKDRHPKEKHSKDRKDKHDKSRHSKEESKYDKEREKIKDDNRYERDSRYDKEERFERAIYEKTKSKDKEHKNKRKDRKDDNIKASKDHSREKHKHTHPHESFIDKQREVRKIDDKLKIVVEQKDRKEKSKTKDKKDPKLEKELHQRKRETERNAYSEMTSIESKEIFAKGDSIIINVSFNRNSSPKDVSTSEALEVNSADQILTKEDLDKDANLNEDLRSKSKSSDKKSSLDGMSVKRPVTPPERPTQVLSVSESYWQGGDDPDGNNSIASDKSDEESHHDDDNDSVGSVNDADNFSNSSNSTDDLANQEAKDGTIEMEAKSTVSEELIDKFSKEEDTFISKRRSPRSPSPPSPADNDSYDPCEPTKSPSPSFPAPPPLPSSNPKPPPSPELPPLPPEPEPTDVVHEESHSVLHNQTPPVVSSTAQPVTVETQTPSSLAFTGMLLPPPSFLSHSSQANNLSNISSLLPPRTLSFQVNGSNILATNHMPPVMAGNFIHTDTSLPPPPNPPNIPHMTSVPPPPPPPSAISLISQIRHPQLNVQPPLPPNSILQNLGIAHNLNIPQLQLPPLPHLPPNLCAALANHQSPLPFTTQNLPVSLPSNITNQQSNRFLAPNQVPLMPNQNISNNKPHVMSITQMLSHCQTIPVSSNQKSEQPSKPPTPGEKNEVIDMDVDSPYSPGDCSVDSVNDYSPTGSPLPSTPKETGDIFDTLFSADIRTSEKRPHESVSKHERSKSRSGSKGTNESSSKKSKHDHRTDSKSKHSVKMQIEKNKKARKEQKIAEKILKLEDSQLKILDELPSSAVEMQVKEKFLKKLNRQERVIEEVKLALKPFYKSRDVNKEEYKDILRRAVPKICHNKSGEINPVKVKYLVECYIKKVRHSKKRSDKKKSKFS